MRSPSLTRKTKVENGRLVSSYKWGGHRVDVCDSARNGILAIELFQDEELAPEQKAPLLIRMLFPKPEDALAIAGERLGDLLIDIVWEAFGLDISSEAATPRSTRMRSSTSQRTRGESAPRCSNASASIGMTWPAPSHTPTCARF